MKKLEKVRDSYNELIGYKMGEWYLMKHEGFGGSISWFISKTDKNCYSSYSFNIAENNGEIEVVDSFKKGKEILIARNIALSKKIKDRLVKFNEAIKNVKQGDCEKYAMNMFRLEAYLEGLEDCGMITKQERNVLEHNRGLVF